MIDAVSSVKKINLLLNRDLFRTVKTFLILLAAVAYFLGLRSNSNNFFVIKMTEIISNNIGASPFPHVPPMEVTKNK